MAGGSLYRCTRLDFPTNSPRSVNTDQIMHGYEPPLADPADYAVPKTLRMVDAHAHWWDHADKTVTWSVSRRHCQHPRLMWSWRLDPARFSPPDDPSDRSGVGVSQ